MLHCLSVLARACHLVKDFHAFSFTRFLRCARLLVTRARRRRRRELCACVTCVLLLLLILRSLLLRDDEPRGERDVRHQRCVRACACVLCACVRVCACQPTLMVMFRSLLPQDDQRKGIEMWATRGACVCVRVHVRVCVRVCCVRVPAYCCCCYSCSASVAPRRPAVGGDMGHQRCVRACVCVVCMDVRVCACVRASMPACMCIQDDQAEREMRCAPPEVRVCACVCMCVCVRACACACVCVRVCCVRVPAYCCCCCSCSAPRRPAREEARCGPPEVCVHACVLCAWVCVCVCEHSCVRVHTSVVNT